MSILCVAIKVLRCLEKGGTEHWGKDHVGCPMATEMFFLEGTHNLIWDYVQLFKQYELHFTYLSSEQIGILYASFKCSILSFGSLSLEARGQ